MKFSINQEIFIAFDNPRIGLVVAKDVNNKGSNQEVLDLLSSIFGEVQEKYAGKVLSSEPEIANWREAYRAFGAKPKKYPNSVEALYKRVVKEGRINQILPLVDIYNYISLKYMLPAGGEDIDKIQGDVELTIAKDDEKPVVVLGKPEEQQPPAGEVIYKDDAGTMVRRWNWREVERTALSEETANCILVLEALDPTTDEKLEEATKELAHLVEKHTNAKVVTHLLDEESFSVEI